jgi:CMP-N,N'-diacetyllegionaminic acid synthase
VALKGQRVLAVVPARGGSKGVPRKNIHPLAGLPLLAHTARLIATLGYVDRAVVSTDDAVIGEAAVAHGLAFPFVRPPEISGDLIGDWPVLEHACREVERIDGGTYDVIVMLQPTSPLRRPEHVTAVVIKLIEEGWDAVWTVSPTDSKYHPIKALTVAPDGAMDLYLPDVPANPPRQQLGPVFHRNGAAYAFSRDCLFKQKSIKGRRSAAVVVETPMVSIDTLDDFARVEAIMQEAAAR